MSADTAKFLHNVGLTIAVGSTNRIKIAAARLGVERALRVPIASCTGYEVASGVSNQPMGDLETRCGAMQRAQRAVAAYIVARGCAPDYAVGLEGGCVDDLVRVPAAVSASSGTIDDESRGDVHELSCFAWMAVIHVASGRWGFARTASFALPQAVAVLVRSGVELGDADDQVFGRTGSKVQDGAVGLLTGGVIDRQAYYEHAIVLACIPFISASHYA